MSPDDRDQPNPDVERVQEASRERKHERSDIVEDIMGGVGNLLEEEKYPVSSEELAVDYADETMDLPNETESLGSVFDRIADERFESPQEAKEAVANELTGQQAGPEEYNDERALSGLEDEDDRSNTLK